ncbi:MAG TPA: glutamate mutase L [Levilinea sp.]|nr:glutamate mutase L [Levilinea sp.]
MATSIVDAESVLAVDIGSVHTRAVLFDVVDGQYHFIASGIVPSTVNAPYSDVQEAVQIALEELHQITGRIFIDHDHQLLIPTQPDGSGVDRLVITYSAGPELRVMTAGLLGEVSLESANRLVNTLPARVVDTLGLSDRRPPDMQIDAILKASPEVIILTGGTEGGATRSVLKMVEIIMLACRVMPQSKRPQVLYAGNTALSRKIKEALDRYTRTTVTSNVRPGIEQEDLDPAIEALANVVTEVRYEQLGGLRRLGSIASFPPQPSSYAYGRVIRFLGRLYDPVKGVLGVDVGASQTILAAAKSGDLTLNVFPFGVGKGLPALLDHSSVAQILQWLPMHATENSIRDYLWHKGLYPANIPVTAETLAIEQAAVRVALQLALVKTLEQSPKLGKAFEPILASGAVFSMAASPVQALLMLLDGIQPAGVTTLILDQNSLIASLGAITGINPILPVQLLESRSFLNLATVISPISRAKYGTPILQATLEYDEGNESRIEVLQGSITALPLRQGQVARIHLQALRPVEIDPRGKRGLGSFKIVGGVCGVVLDARGRPLRLPADASRRRELINKWSLALGG